MNTEKIVIQNCTGDECNSKRVCYDCGDKLGGRFYDITPNGLSVDFQKSLEKIEAISTGITFKKLGDWHAWLYIPELTDGDQGTFLEASGNTFHDLIKNLVKSINYLMIDGAKSTRIRLYKKPMPHQSGNDYLPG